MPNNTNSKAQTSNLKIVMLYDSVDLIVAVQPRAGWFSGALVGPPWSKRENGFVLSETQADGIKLYYEPHCDYDEAAVAKIGKVDAVVTPANSQVLINFPLVRSQRSCLARTLCMQGFFDLCNVVRKGFVMDVASGRYSVKILLRRFNVKLLLRSLTATGCNIACVCEDRHSKDVCERGCLGGFLQVHPTNNAVCNVTTCIVVAAELCTTGAFAGYLSLLAC